ncbi:hypothetical protein NHX12_025357, partial [Muraenolepis orangiensis]
MTQPMQNLQLTQSRKVPGGPASPSAAKRLYRNLSEKLRGGTSSFEDTYFFGKSDRLRKVSTMQGSDCILEAVEQQDLDTVQILLYQYTAEELDLNTPNSQGLTPLDIAIMTNNTPIAKLLLKAGGKESPHFVSVESREAHLSSLVVEAERRADELATQAQKEGLSLDACHKDKQLRAWEWRSKLYRRMRTGFQHARAPEAPTLVRLNVSNSTSLSTVLDNLQSLKCIISGLTTGRLYHVRVSACNMKGWGPTASSLPPSAAPSNWRDGDGREPKRRGHIEAMEHSSKLQNPSRKQSVSRSLKHLFNSSNKFVKTLKRGIYLAAVFYHKDSLLVTTEDQIPIVEVDDSYSSSLMQDFLWFTKLSCMWEDVRWLRQSMSVSMSSSSTLQARHKMLTAAGQLQNLLGTHNLGRVHYEPIKDRHGNVLLVTIRDMETQYSFFSGKWMQVTKLQSQRKSLSTPEEPYALDILIITIQDILAYQRRSTHRLSPGLYLGYLKLSSSVDQIKVLVSQRTPNMLCHTRVRDNTNVSREEWDWLQSLSVTEEAEKEERTEAEGQGAEAEAESEGAKHFRVYSQEVLELGHGVSFLLLLPTADDVCTAPGQANAYTPHSGFLHLPLQMFELGHVATRTCGYQGMWLPEHYQGMWLPEHYQGMWLPEHYQGMWLPEHYQGMWLPGHVATRACGYQGMWLPGHVATRAFHFWAYKEKFISLYCRLSSVLDLDALITQQALREAITDVEVSGAKQRHQLILDYIQQLDEMWRDLRWITDALQYARYKHPRGGVPITCLASASRAESDAQEPKTDSTSSTMDYLPTPSPSPELRRRTAANATTTPDLSTQARHSLGGSAPDVLQIHELRFSKDMPLSLPLSTTPVADATAKILETLSLSAGEPEPGLPQVTPLCALANPPSKRKLLSRSHRGQYFSGPQRWLRGHSGEDGHTGSLSEGIYTRQRNPDLPSPGDPPSPLGPTFVSQASCLLLESRRGRHRDARPHVRRIFVEPCKRASPGHE